MRLKTLRKERPAFENEGAVVSGNRIEISNSGCKPPKYRTNNTFTTVTSLNNSLLSLRMSPSDHAYGMNMYSTKQKPTQQRFLLPSPTEATHLSTYQAIEATYLEHGIRINLNSPPATVITKRQNQITENSTGRSSANNSERYKAFNHRNGSRSSTPLHYSTTVHDTDINSQSSDALQRPPIADPEHMRSRKVSYTQSSDQSNITASERVDQMTLPTQSDIASDTPSLATLIGNNRDLAYMSSLLQTTSGDSFRDIIRRRAGLRATSAIHRHTQSITTTTTTDSNQHEKSSSIMDHPNPLLRSSTNAFLPSTTSSSSFKKLEKDILKHASRIRTNPSKDPSTRRQGSLKSHTNENTSTRMNHPNKPNRTIKSSKCLSLEPLELLLAPASHSLPSPPSSSINFPTINRNNSEQKKNRTNSNRISLADNNNKVHNGVTSFISNEHSKSTLLTDESLSSVKTSPRDRITTNKISQSNSFDSGCCDRSSNSSGDALSVTFLSINQTLSSIPSTRLTSARRSNTHKKVSFDDQPFSVIITTSTYVYKCKR